MPTSQNPPAGPVIGILAGMGPRSTAPFVDLLVTACQELYGARHDIDYPKMLVLSQPAPFYEDRPVDNAALAAATLDGLRTLEAGGAGFLAMACNTVHLYHDQLAAQCRAPLLNIVDIAVRALPRSGLKVAFVGARATAESGMYQRALELAGHRPVELGCQDAIDALLGLVRMTTEPEALRAGWTPILAQAHAADIDAMLVGCLDLTSVVPLARTPLLLVDAGQSLARAVIARWLDERR